MTHNDRRLDHGLRNLAHAYVRATTRTARARIARQAVRVLEQDEEVPAGRKLSVWLYHMRVAGREYRAERLGARADLSQQRSLGNRGQRVELGESLDQLVALQPLLAAAVQAL